MEKKYELTNNTKEVNGIILHQIKAVKNFSEIKAGDLGGWVEKEDNLSQNGLCWISQNASVFNNARVYDDARVYSNARVYDDARVYSNARVYDQSQVFENAQVFDKAYIFHNACISNNAFICSICDYKVFHDDDDYITIYRIKDRSIYVNTLDFNGLLDEFINNIKEKYKDTDQEKKYIFITELAKLYLEKR